MKRKIIEIDEEKCNGCSLCLPNCPEGAIQVIDGKARLVSDIFCDGLGACIGHCPEGAIAVTEREAEPYDERKVIARIAAQGRAVIEAHLRHLKEHNETGYLREAMEYLQETGQTPATCEDRLACGCPGSMARELKREVEVDSADRAVSELSHWPIQLHLISPQAPYFQKADLLLAADCTAFALGAFHADLLRNRKLVIACPKLDSGQEIYRQKLTALIDEAKINTLTLAIMEVPCCRGLFNLAHQAIAAAGRKVPVKLVIIGVRGNIISEEWV